MLGRGRDFGAGNAVPSWVPDAACLYLLHTEKGASIRDLAREIGCHASTVLRRIRTFESRRDDMLVDHALSRLGCRVACNQGAGSPIQETAMTAQSGATSAPKTTSESPSVAEVTGAQLRVEGLRILRRLCETGAVLAVAAQMDKAVVVRDGADEDPTRTATLERAVAEAMALKGWIACDAPGRISRYHITKAGRSALSGFMAEAENRASGFADAQAGFDSGDSDPVPQDGDSERRRVRYNMAESPLIGLSRRKERDGTRFITDDMVRAGERLREDFELSQMGPKVTQDWNRFLTGPSTGGSARGGHGRGAEAARARVEGALADLGPGLGDIALRCCCHLEGLERAEKRMGWSARSGKIVLRIALQRLKRHYDELGDAGGMIG
ncbi:DUF6456 domain-containing protein [Rhodobacteraceae bacterium KMM 6894]|nr:DUF6456 domain-containing protein [Rhodobacteraceae bacterium KMM 6894]